MRYSESLNLALHDIMEEDESVYLLGEDICDPYGGAFKVTKGLSTKFPDRVLNMPISESAIVGIATGLAMSGFKPIVEIMFGDFLTLCMDQIVNGASKFVQMFDMPVPLIIRTPMGGYRGYGPTHSQSLESLFLHIPNLNVIYPSVYHDPGQLLKTCMEKMTQPTLFIEAKPCYSFQLFFNDLTPETRVSTVRVKGTELFDADVTIFTYGNCAPLVMKAMGDVFLEREIVVEAYISSFINLPDIDVPTASTILIVEEFIGWGEFMSTALYQDRWETLSKPISFVQGVRSVIPAAKHLEYNTLPQTEDIKRAIYGIV